MSVTLSDVCIFLNGGTPSKSIPRYFAGNIPWITGADIAGPVVESARSFITEEAIRHSATNRVPAGTVLLVTRTSVGKVAIAGTELCFSQDITALTPAPQKLDTAYLMQFLRSQEGYFERLARGATIKGITREIVDRLEIPLPPLAEQQRIAAILDQAEVLRAKRRHALAQLDTLTQSLFLDLFGDPVNNPKGWPKQPMGKLMNIRRGSSPRPIEQFLGGTINWIKIGDATSGDDIYISHCADKIIEGGLKKTVYLKAGSLIFANCGVSLGFARILKIDGCIHDGWLSLADVPEDRLDKLFLLKALNAITTRFRKMAPEGTQPNLNTALIKSFPIVLPPLPLQHEFTAQVSAVERLKAAQRASLAKLDALFASLQHRAFRGEL